MVSIPKPLQEAVIEVKSERIRGAAWCAMRIIEGLLDSITLGYNLCKDSEKIYNIIVSSNPSMASLRWVAYIFREGCKTNKLSEVLRRLLFEMSETRRRIPEVALELFDRITKVITFSYSSNVEAVLRMAASRGLLESVIALESRPGGEGIVLAKRLKELGIKVKIVPDAMMHIYIKNVDFVMVGADTITKDGCLVHKVGTLLLAEKAYDNNRPLVVVFEPYKIGLDEMCNDVHIIKREYLIENWGSEVYQLFDITPPELISLGVTSEGISEWNTDWIDKVLTSFRSRVLS